MKRRGIVLILGGVLALAGCSAPAPEPTADPYAQALITCLDAYEKAPKWTADLGGATGACDTWEESQGRDAFVDWWTDPEEWQPYMENVYTLEELS